MNPKDNFKELQKQWYKKLKDEGFQDIEASNAEMFPRPGRSHVSDDSPDKILAIMEYYSMARSFLIDHEFKSEKHKTIWEYHSEGMSVREISLVMKPLELPGTDKSTIHQTIKSLEKLMKARYLAP